MVRYADLHDLNALVTLEDMCFTADHLSRRNYRELLQKSSAEILVSEQHQQIIGCAVTLFRKNSLQARLYSLAVSPAYRNHGIADALCKKMESHALKRNCQTLILEVHTHNTSAIQFYKKQGYHIFGTYHHFYQDGTNAIRMKKNLL